MSDSPYVEIPMSDEYFELDTIRRRNSPTKSKADAVTGEVSQFIKLYGRIPNKLKVQKQILTQDENRKIKTPLMPEELIDVIDAKETEEPFTLETFDDLVRMHLEKDKDFILARVTTMDPIDSNRFYYSYYAAHHINKILFRTQPEESLLHRMQAKNPLNNMDIVGDVHYYVISKTSPIPKTAKSPTKSKLYEIASNHESKIEKILSPALERILGYSQDRKMTLHLMIKPDLKIESHSKEKSVNSVSSSRRNSADDAAVITVHSATKEKDLHDDSNINVASLEKDQEKIYTKIRSISYQNHSDGANSISEWMKIHTQHEAKRAKIISVKTQPDVSTPLVKECTWEAHYFASDDDFLMDSKIRAYFKENALETADAMLFSLPSSNNHNFSNGIQHPALINYVFSYQDSSGNIHGTITPRQLRQIIVLSLIIGILLVKIFAPPHFFFVGIALLLLAFCLFLLVLV